MHLRLWPYKVLSTTARHFARSLHRPALDQLKAEARAGFEDLERASMRRIAVEQPLYEKLNIYQPIVRKTIALHNYYNIAGPTPRLNFLTMLLNETKELENISEKEIWTQLAKHASLSPRKTLQLLSWILHNARAKIGMPASSQEFVHKQKNQRYQREMQQEFGRRTEIRKAVEFLALKGHSMLNPKEIDALLSVLLNMRVDRFEANDPWRPKYYEVLGNLAQVVQRLLLRKFVPIESKKFYQQFFTQAPKPPVLSLSLACRLVLAFAKLQSFIKLDEKQVNQGDRVGAQARERVTKSQREFKLRFNKLWDSSISVLGQYLNYAAVSDLLDLAKASSIRESYSLKVLPRICALRLPEMTPSEVGALGRSLAGFEISESIDDRFDAKCAEIVSDDRLELAKKLEFMKQLAWYNKQLRLAKTWKIISGETEKLLDEGISRQVILAVSLLSESGRLSQKVIAKVGVALRSEKGTLSQKLEWYFGQKANHPANFFARHPTRMPSKHELKDMGEYERGVRNVEGEFMERVELLAVLAKERRVPTAIVKKLAKEVKDGAVKLGEPGLDLSGVVKVKRLGRAIVELGGARRRVQGVGGGGGVLEELGRLVGKQQSERQFK